MSVSKLAVVPDLIDAPSPQSLALLPLGELCQLASEKANRYYDDVLTYSPKVFIPLTRLCRDVCHYCTFAKTPKRVAAPFMSLDEVRNVAVAGEAAGCSEALLTLGEKPEMRYKAAQDWLAQRGYASTVDYIEAACRVILSETSLLPHVNAGTLSFGELKKLRPVMASMGIMLESGSSRLMLRGNAHFGSPDKTPWRRWATLARAGRALIPTTTGLLVGIGEDRQERIRDLVNLARLHLRYGHIQEVIIQNFRAKSDTLMAQWPDTSLDELRWTIAMARLILPDGISIQAPPNLSPDSLKPLIESGLNDWGGISSVTQDFVNPEAPWPHLELLRSVSGSCGKVLRARLPVYPNFVEATEWLAPSMRSRCLKQIDSIGLIREDSWRAGTVSDRSSTPRAPALLRSDPKVERILSARLLGREIGERDMTRLFTAGDLSCEALYRTADVLRKQQVGEAVTYVVNRNINYTNVCQYTCHFCAFSKGLPKSEGRERPYDIGGEELQRRTLEAWSLGATEVCLQGGIHPDYDGNTYLSILAAVRKAVPNIHIHAFSPLEIRHGAATLGLDVPSYLSVLVEAGLNTIPGTAAEILDDEIRALICPGKLSSDEWLETMRAAHQCGLRSTATIMFGHIEHPRHWSRHLLAVRDLQKETGGFTEFVPLPFVADEAPIYRRGLSRPGPTLQEAFKMHAVARIVLGDVLPNIQVSWVKMGPQYALEGLSFGANDVGGTLMNESISRAAGADHGQCWTPEQMVSGIEACNRVARQRTTLYQAPADEQVVKSMAAPMVLTNVYNEAASARSRSKLT